MTEIKVEMFGGGQLKEIDAHYRVLTRDIKGSAA